MFTPLPPSPRKVLGGVALALTVLGSGCKAKKPPNPPDKADEQAQREAKAEEDALLAQVARNPSMKPMLVDDARCNKTSKKVHQVDVNNDGRADLLTLTARDKLGERLVCKQADLNFDGRIDAFLHYDEQGVLNREQYDMDFDGRIDLGRYYKENLLFLDEQDLDHDGYVDAWRRYDKARLVRIDHDRDHDGRPDMFTFYAAGQIDRVGYDVDGDGKVDRWDQDVADRAKEALTIRNREIEKLRADEEAEYIEDQPEPPTETDDKTPPGADGKASEKDAKDAKGKGSKGKDSKKGAKGKGSKKDTKGSKKDAKGSKKPAKAGSQGDDKDSKSDEPKKDAKPANKDAATEKPKPKKPGKGT